MSEWQQMALIPFELQTPAGRTIWVSDGVLGFARPMGEGETVEQAVADFETAGESAVEVRVYQGGVWVE